MEQGRGPKKRKRTAVNDQREEHRASIHANRLRVSKQNGRGSADRVRAILLVYKVCKGVVLCRAKHVLEQQLSSDCVQLRPNN